MSARLRAASIFCSEVAVLCGAGPGGARPSTTQHRHLATICKRSDPWVASLNPKKCQGDRGHLVTTVNVQPVYLQAIDSVNSGPMLNFRTVDKKRRGDDTTQQA